MSKRNFFFFLLFFSVFPGFALNAADNQPLAVSWITPQGNNVQPAEKIVFQFNQPVAALGKMERDSSEIPIRIKPALDCEWRWMNQSALACFLPSGRGMKAATAYDITVFPEFKSLSGNKSAGKQNFKIETVRPEIMPSSCFLTDFITPQRPQWQISFKTAADIKSLRARIFFKADGKKIKADVSPVFCYSWDTDCSSKYLVVPEKDLGVDMPYEIVYEPGFKALNAGSLKSQDNGVAAKGRTLPVFSVQALRCYNPQTKSTEEYTAAQTRKKAPECGFGYPVSISLSDKAVLNEISKQVKGKPFIRVADEERLSDTVWLGELAAGREYTVTVSPDLTDIWGNKLGKEETFSFKVSDRPASLKTDTAFGVLEQNETTDLTGYAANLDSVHIDYAGFTAKNNVRGIYDVKGICPEIRNIAYPFDYGVRTMLEGRSGFLFGRFTSVPAVRQQEHFFVSVAPWQVVAKIGWFDSLVWVVDMQTGKPVKRAAVEIRRQNLTNPSVRAEKFASAKTDGTGRAVLPGYGRFDPKAALLNAWDIKKDSLVLAVTKGKETAVLPLKSAFSLSAGSLSGWAVSSVYYPEPYSYLRSFGITPQGVYRQGDEVQYKIYVREENDSVLGKAPADGYILTVTDPAGQTVFEQKDLKLSDFGAAHGSFRLPAQAVLGWYDVHLKYGEKTMTPMRFMVTDFAPSPFKSVTELNGKIFFAGDETKITSEASLFSGGAYAGAPARQTGVLSSASFSPDRKDEEENFSFDSPLTQEEAAEQVLFDQEGKTDEKGILAKTFKMPVSPKPYGKLRFETKVFDDGGRSASSYASAEYFSVDRLVGLRRTEWNVSTGKPAAVEYTVVAPDRTPAAGVPVEITFVRMFNKLVREKSAGNVYRMTYAEQEEKAASCSGVSAQTPQACSFVPEKSGMYKAVALVHDTRGRPHKSEISFYVSGDGYTAWNSGENRLKMTPDKASYRPGEDISVLIENPVPGALALVSVERYGILDSFVQELKGSAPVVRIPVRDDYFPGVYVSVSLFSPRVDKPAEGEADLGKPSEWTGYLNIPVIDEARRIGLKISSDKADYRPRQKARIDIQAHVPGRKKQPVEAAVVVLDEAVLSLLPEGIKAYNPYDGLNRLGSLDVRTYSLIKQLIGRRNLEKKGANQGGDGGSGFALRDVFKFVGYWNPSLKLDKNGKGSFEMTLPDNLTGWRVIVLAVSPEKFSGMGETRFTVSQPLEIRPLLPNQVRAGDVFTPSVSVLNRTDKPAAVTAVMQVSGAAEKAFAVEKKFTLKPFERLPLSFVSVAARLPAGTVSGGIELTFTASSGTETDGVVKKVPVLNLTQMQTAALFGSSESSEKFPLDVPEGIRQFGGRLEMSVSPSVMNGLSGAVAAMKDYPYSCWEQQISRALAAAVYVRARAGIAPDDLWPQADDIVRQTLEKASAFQAPNGGMAFFVPHNAYVSPYLSAYTSFVFVKLAEMGYDIPAQAENNLAKYLSGIFRYTKDDARARENLTVRLMSVPFLKKHGLVRDADIAAFARDLPMMSVFDKAMYLNADSGSRAVWDSLMDNADKTSGTVLFKESGRPAAYGIFASAARDNCALLPPAVRGNPAAAQELARGVLSLRLRSGAWANTQANAFCLSGLYDFALSAETAKVDMQIEGRLDGRKILSAGFNQKSAAPVLSSADLAPADAGRKMEVSMSKTGEGRYYYAAELSYPSDLEKAVNAGLEITRTIEVERGGKFEPLEIGRVLERGDLVRVTLKVVNPERRNMVAVSDPVAGAFEPVNRMLAASSAFDADRAQDDGASFLSGFYFKEVGHKSVNFYAETLNAGTYTLSYAAQVVADGVFTAFPAKAEAMYIPDVFGLTSAETVTVE